MKTLQRTIAYALTVICLGIGMTAYAQTLTQRIILQDTPDSLLLKSFHRYFDKEGNYCFIVEKAKKQYFILTPHDTLGPFCYVGSIYGRTYGRTGEIVYVREQSEQPDGPLYYVSGSGTKVYGPAVGEIQQYVADSESGGVALTTLSNDTVHRYLNCREVLCCHRTEMRERDITDEKWAAFSQNGHVLYSVKKDTLYRMYVDGRVVDSAAFQFIELAINNNGDYIFAEGFRPQQQYGQNNYWVFDGQLSPPLSMNDPELYLNSAFYPEIVTGKINEKGFYAIQRVGERSYCVVMNNRIYPIEGRIDKILYKCFSFDGSQLVFYGIKENTYYQFVIK